MGSPATHKDTAINPENKKSYSSAPEDAPPFETSVRSGLMRLAMS